MIGRPGQIMYSFIAIIFCQVLFVPAVLFADDLLPADRPIEQVIDHYINSRIEADNVTPAQTAEPVELLRRTTLDLAGRIPTAAEVEDFLAASESDRRNHLVERLMESADFAYHQRNWIDELLLAEIKTDDAWREYLLTAVRENRPWDELFRELILPDEGDEQHRAAAEFLKARVKSLDDMTNDVSRLFFGVSINCAQCHDHPLVDDWQQDHYFGFQSFFSRTFQTKRGPLAEKHSGAVKFKTVLGEEKTAEFMFLTSVSVSEPKIEKPKEQRKKADEAVKKAMKDKDAPLPPAPDFSPRRELVELALTPGETNYFARSIVNRLWVRFFGRGLVDPPDQMHSGNVASHPELLAWLERDLMTHDYDLNRLIRGIALSDAYARSSRWVGDDDPPAADYFAIASPRVLTPRQFALSLLIATQNSANLPGIDKPDEWAKRREEWEKSAGGMANQLERPGPNFQVSVDEALLFSNNDRIRNDYLRDSGDRLVGQLKSISDQRQLLETAFRAILSREPDAEELAAFQEYLSEREDRPVEGIQQVVWALITSPEMRFNY